MGGDEQRPARATDTYVPDTTGGPPVRLTLGLEVARSCSRRGSGARGLLLWSPKGPTRDGNFCSRPQRQDKGQCPLSTSCTFHLPGLRGLRWWDSDPFSQRAEARAGPLTTK